MKSILTSFAIAAFSLPLFAADFDPTAPVYEIAIQQPKEGQLEAWSGIRHGLVGYLQSLPSVQADWTLQSFFTLPEPNSSEVYFGITRWQSMNAFVEVAEPFSKTDDWANFNKTVDFLGYVQAQPIDGKPFILEDYITSPEQVLEVAIRTPKEGMVEKFETTREAFFAKVAEQDGYLFHQEMQNADGSRSVLIGWENDAAFQNALGALSQMEEMSAFFGTVDVVAYQAGHLSTDW